MTLPPNEWDKTDQIHSELVSDVTHLPPRTGRFFSEPIARLLEAKPFVPYPFFTNGHAQTILGFVWPRYLTTLPSEIIEERLFEVEPNVHLLAHCRWQIQPLTHPTMLLVHGLEGSSNSKPVLGAADKAFVRGFNVVRLNLRTCGGTEHLAPTLYHSEMIGDLRAVISELIEDDHLKSIFLVGFSLGGNMLLKLAGEDADAVAPEVSGICAVSPAIDLSSCAEAIRDRSNWVYEQYFLRSLRRRLRVQEQLYPELYDTSELHLVHTIKDFDELYTAQYGGFQGADDYYKRASALSFIEHIQKPTLIIHAQDDPFVPFMPLTHPSVLNNPLVLLLTPEYGGHVGFVADAGLGEDRFWAENRIADFCQLIDSSSATESEPSA